MPPRRAFKKPVFQPVVMFQVQTPTDRLAVEQVYSLQRGVAETMDTERSRKQTIGISEIGNPCNKCVARKLALLHPKPQDPNWKAQVGTFIHAGLEQHFGETRPPMSWGVQSDDPRLDSPTDAQPHTHLEQRLQVWEYKGFTLEGSCDVFVEGRTFGLVTDWKTQGSKKLLGKTAKGDIGQTYLVQMMTYGFGWERLGKTVTHVDLHALPRDDDLNNSKAVLMRYDRQIVIDALARLATLIDASEIVGWQAVVDAQATDSECWDCPRYDAAEAQNFEKDFFG